MARTFHHAVRPRRRCARSAEPMPTNIKPMLAVLAASLPLDPQHYSFEYKWDGIRCLCYWDGDALRLQSRNDLSITHRYPELHRLGIAFGSRSAILDGEIVALDDAGRPSFPALQRRMHVEDPRIIQRLSAEAPICFMIFDVLYLDGSLTMNLPLLERRDRLEQLTLAGPNWQAPPAQVGEGLALLESVRAQGLEGIVAKRIDSVYEPGRRSPAWIKIKVIQRQELVIGGWVPEGGTDPHRVGTLLVGYYEPGRGLRYAGGVGSGFNEAWHRRLTGMLRQLRRDASPFVDPVPKPGAIFVRPELVAEVEYRRWPDGGSIQQAAFKGLRDDKRARDVVLERACRGSSG